MTANVQVEIEQYKKMMTRKLIYIIVAAVLCIVGTAAYYELKINALIGAVYLKSPKAVESLTYVLFRKVITMGNLSAVSKAMKSAGYTENGAWYLFQNSGQLYVLLFVFIIITVFCTVGISQVIKIGQDDIFYKMKSVITDNESLNKELTAKNNILVQQKTEIQQYMENIAHQIKTPLAGISLMLDHMEPKEMADKAYLQVSKVSDFVYQLLNISRMESGKVHFIQESLNLKDLLQDAIISIIGNHRVYDDKTYDDKTYDINSFRCNEYEIRLECEEEVNIVGDEKWLTECFINLISNCAESVQKQDNGLVVVHVDNAGEKCMITVSDNGQGFQGKDISSIFNRFETDRNSKEFHVGIGLNLSKIIVLAHHGIITAMNSDNLGGAEFRIVLPQYHLKQKLKM